MKKDKLWSLPFVLILLINAINGVASYMINPLIPSYLMTKGIDFALTGTIASLLSWVALIFRPASGLICDRANKKRVLLIAFIATMFCTAGYVFAGNVTQIILVRVMHGIAFAISGTVSMAFATEFIPRSRTAEGIGYLGIATLAGTMFGPQIGTYISEIFGMSALFITSCGMCIVCIAVTIFVPYQSKPLEKKTELDGSRRIHLKDFFAVELSFYVFLIGLMSAGNGIISYYLVDFGKSRGIENIALFFTFYSLTLLVMKPFIGRIQDSKGIKAILYPALVIYVVGIIILANAYTLVPVLIAAVFKAVGQGNGTPAIQAESVKKLGNERSGVAISTCLCGQDIGNAIGPIYASCMVKAINYNAMFSIYAAALLLGAVVYFFYNRKVKGKI